MGLTTYTPTAKPGKYDQEVATLVDAVKNGDENAAWEQTVEQHTKRDGTLDNGRGEATLFQKSALAQGFTARVVSNVDNGDGTSTLTFVLRDKYKSKTRKAE